MVDRRFVRVVTVVACLLGGGAVLGAAQSAAAWSPATTGWVLWLSGWDMPDAGQWVHHSRAPVGGTPTHVQCKRRAGKLLAALQGKQSDQIRTVERRQEAFGEAIVVHGSDGTTRVSASQCFPESVDPRAGAPRRGAAQRVPPRGAGAWRGGRRTGGVMAPCRHGGQAVARTQHFCPPACLLTWAIGQGNVDALRAWVHDQIREAERRGDAASQPALLRAYTAWARQRRADA